MLPMPIVDLRERARQLGESGKRVSVLWKASESIRPAGTSSTTSTTAPARAAVP
jgi:hypothetical protein